jgi:hypothetical protein
MTWELFRRGRWGFLGAYLAAVALPALLYTALRVDGAFDPADRALIVIHMVLMLFAAMAFCSPIFSALGDPSRLYAYPATAATIAAWNLVPAMAAVSSGYLATAATLNALFHVDWPLWGPALFLPAGLAVFAATMWLAGKSAWHWFVIVVPAMAAVGVWFNSRHGLLFPSSRAHLWREVTVDEILTMLAATAAAYYAAVVGVARSRRGDAPRTPRFLLWIGRLLDALLDPAPALGAAFRSPAQAQFWFEWRQKGWFMPAIVLLLGAGFGLGWLCFNRVPLTLFEGAFWGGAILPLGGLIIGLLIGNAGPTDSKMEMGHFLAARPMTSAEMARIMLKTAALSVLAAWVLWVLGFLAVCVVLQAAQAQVPMILPGPQGWRQFPVMLFGAWLSVALLATLAQAGRPRLTMTLFCSAMALMLGGLLFTKYVLYRDPLLAAQFRNGSLIAAGLIFALGTAWAFVAARRRSLIGSPTVYAAVGIWIAASALVVSLRWSALAAPLSVYVFVIGVLALAAFPLAGAPLALAWNRNR